jgi:hypothetical protein
MAYYSAAQVKIGSGSIGSETMVTLNHVTNVSVNSSLARTDVGVLGRGKPLAQRPVMNYTPVEFSMDIIKTDNSLETCLALVNSTGITANLVETRPAYATLGIKNVQVLFSEAHSTVFDGGRDLKSGVLTSYSLQGGISEPVRCSVGMQFLDQSGYSLSAARTSPAIDTNLVKPESVSLTGIQFSGYGLSGVNVQSFQLGVTFDRNSVMQLGSRFPAERPITNASATFSVNGYINGFNNGLSGMGQYSRGDPMNGEITLTLYPANNVAPTTVTLVRPYFDSESITPQVGGFATVSYSFSLPLGPNPNETSDGSVLRITS